MLDLLLGALDLSCRWSHKLVPVRVPVLVRVIQNAVDLFLKKQQVDGMVQYRAEKNGIVQVGVGKGSFDNDHLMDNIKTILDEIQDVKPEKFGKGKKMTKK